MNELLNLREKIEAAGLIFPEVCRHAELIAAALTSRDTTRFLTIEDTCRTDNGGILPQTMMQKVCETLPDAANLHGLVAFVPAAGAASRYFQELRNVLQALADRDRDRAMSLRSEQVSAGARNWALPREWSRFFDAPDEDAKMISAIEIDRLVEEASLPKALLPCVRERQTFLDLKLLEHGGTGLLEGEVYVAPPGKIPDFLAIANRHERPIHCIEQGPALSTIRFLETGKPLIDELGNLSIVPAGHGTLAQLFPEITKFFPNCQGLFIRNIDNVCGTNPKVMSTVKVFLRFYFFLKEQISSIRECLPTKIEIASQIATKTLESLEFSKKPPRDGIPDVEQPLWQLLEDLFHTHCRAGRTLKDLYHRPLNVLGQVPNSGTDVGGTPCFVKTSEGTAKICVEVPHASPTDAQRFLENPKVATHFNPVFVAAEPPSRRDHYADAGDLWLLSRKPYKGSTVYYYETALYELLGNSHLANTVFVEVPRAIFNPHKTVRDSVGRALDDWIS